MATATNGNNNVNEENAAIIGNNSKEIVKILENTENAKVLEMVLSVEIDENEKNRKLDEIEKILDMFFEDAFGHNNYDEDEILIHFSMNKIVKLKRNFGKRHIRAIFGFISN